MTPEAIHLYGNSIPYIFMNSVVVIDCILCLIYESFSDERRMVPCILALGSSILLLILSCLLPDGTVLASIIMSWLTSIFILLIQRIIAQRDAELTIESADCPERCRHSMFFLKSEAESYIFLLAAVFSIVGITLQALALKHDEQSIRAFQFTKGCMFAVWSSLLLHVLLKWRVQESVGTAKWWFRLERDNDLLGLPLLFLPVWSSEIIVLVVAYSRNEHNMHPALSYLNQVDLWTFCSTHIAWLGWSIFSRPSRMRMKTYDQDLASIELLTDEYSEGDGMELDEGTVRTNMFSLGRGTFGLHPSRDQRFHRDDTAIQEQIQEWQKQSACTMADTTTSYGGSTKAGQSSAVDGLA